MLHSPKLVCGLNALGIAVPNAIQSDALPLALSGRDILLSAQTGAGKTVCFLLPMLDRLLRAGSRQSGLIVAPTAHLAEQHASVAKRIASSLPTPVSIGCDLEPSCQRPAQQLVVATRDVVLQRARDGTLATNALRVVAIDEVDDVLCTPAAAPTDVAQQAASAMRAEEADEILSAVLPCEDSPDTLSAERQFLLTTAHLTRAHEAELLQRFPRAHRISHRGVLVPTLRQVYHYVSERSSKAEQLLAVLGRAQADPWLRCGTTMVFCATAATARTVHAALRHALPETARPLVLEEECAAEERAAALAEFADGTSSLLVATDLAARGLDLPLVRHVVMFDMPDDPIAFVHCAGRTARRGQRGLVTCLVHKGGLTNTQQHHALRPADKLNFG